MAKAPKPKKSDRIPRIRSNHHKMDKPANRRLGGPRKTLTPKQSRVFHDYAVGNISDEEYQIKLRRMRKTFLTV